ncbi:hypothetical protein CYMTET_54832 [Cymbomonas tetramitiformis]|uniref:Chlorophyll a-b binding protein, chloroplastic n=1 Tax=Cymbomonas tetramitiformis TaxID=36881 RepID=A0AAE0ENC6_9CHLO|nr:hypothetical protein CYMTET_54832 [Cymbomonas tetramitiformis]|eukprot:gene21504-25862_t
MASLSMTSLSVRTFSNAPFQAKNQKTRAASRASRVVVAEASEESEEPAPAPAPPAWCAGLAGSTAPMGQFDPMNKLEGADVNQIKLYREAEITHGRVSMLAVLGIAVGENFNPLFDGKITGPAINHFQQVPEFFWTSVVFAIACAEGFRLTKGWVNPVGGGLWALRENYSPGDLGFDPLGLKPTNAVELTARQNKELNNGRLAMIAVAGIVVQELITGEKIF